MTEVLIIGAGPTGLMAACQLAVLNIPFRIIDKNEDHTSQSRAIVIHAASMELFSRLGIEDEFLKPGKQVKALNFIARRTIIHIPLFSEYGKHLTEFPYFLALEQSHTEQILVDFLERRGHKVERNAELIDLTQTDDQVSASLKYQDDRTETLTAKWLLGADGAKSQVRHALNIPFGGETYPADLFVLDCKVSWPLKDDELFLAFSNTTFAGFFPLPNGRCRVISFVPEDLKGKSDLSFEDISGSFANRMQLDIKLYDPSWISTYRAHHRYVSQFRKGRCFLMGDAAHVHSPVGAQGMNTGLQDASNLAWKLALVIQGKAKDILLSSYEDERLPFARELVKTTDRGFSFAVSKNAVTKTLRFYIFPRVLALIIRNRHLARFIFRRISQIGIIYNKSVLVENSSEGNFPSDAPKPGQRLPYFEFIDDSGSKINVQEFVKERPVTLLFNIGTTDDIRNEVAKYSHISVKNVLLTEKAKELFKRFGIREKGYFLVRPDLYVAYRCDSGSANGFRAFMSQIFIY
ncbi:MAG: hypothetical protein C5B59_12640 [Bacteroidetes bacterium]|nr:MAG: hypothetical protein C5B59_12640 [Bacteroidota bacterium]